MYIIGLMSGTSADAVDAALVEWPESRELKPFQLVAYQETALDSVLRLRIHQLAAGRIAGEDALREIAELDVLLAEVFARCALSLLEEAGMVSEQVAAIASHGQTVGHFPEVHSSLQLGSPSVIAERTGCLVVGNFRMRDLGAGGEGAPLAPFFHHAVFSSPEENRAVLNLGGIANLTWLPAEGTGEEVVAFDVGPANSLLDTVTSLCTDGKESFDQDGTRACQGAVDRELLQELLEDPFLALPPPKSTGRERYGLKEAEALVHRWKGRSENDLLRTLNRFSAEAVGKACRDFLGSPERILVGGGGVHNPVLMEDLREIFAEANVDLFDDHGVPADAAEAMAFSLLGRNTLLGIPNHLPQCTGASRAAILGELALVPNRIKLR